MNGRPVNQDVASDELRAMVEQFRTEGLPQPVPLDEEIAGSLTGEQVAILQELLPLDRNCCL